jgi:hypothetical protein
VPPLPPLSYSVQDIKQQVLDVTAIHQRVFVGDMQRFNTVEIRPQTRACDILDAVARQGELRDEASGEAGGWMLWEIAQDFGMGIVDVSLTIYSLTSLKSDRFATMSFPVRCTLLGTATSE